LPKAETPKIEISKPTLIYNSYNLDPNWRKDEDVNRILLLEPSHFKKFPIGSKVMEFILNLSKNISGIQITVDEVSQLRLLYNDSPLRKGA
jgi:deoxyribodipyrimidine photo-lyase